MKLRTEIDIPHGKFAISHKQSGLLVGSCFANNIGLRMQCSGFNVNVNPFGVLYNPHSVANSLSMLADRKKMNREDLLFNNELWYSYLFHGSFSGTDPQTVLSAMNDSLTKGSEAFRKADYIIITLGTSWVYTLLKSGEIVSNCHKTPAREFKRNKMSCNEIIDTLSPLLTGVLANKQVIFTVSPIRHLKDGLEGNQLSKATLLVAVHELKNRHDNVSYFPAYEIMMDDLRDYRFYERDMVHPTDVAVDYIWDRFSETYFTKDTMQLIERVENIRKALNHRPVNPDTLQYRTFVNETRKKIDQLKSEHPEINLDTTTDL